MFPLGNDVRDLLAPQGYVLVFSYFHQASKRLEQVCGPQAASDTEICVVWLVSTKRVGSYYPCTSRTELDCVSNTDTLSEPELFGHKRGAFNLRIRS